MDRKLFLIVFSKKVDRDDVTAIFDGRSDSFWFYNLPNSIFLKSTLSSKEIYNLIEEGIGSERCFITEVKNHWGRLPKDHWKYFD